jgi:hypothetical protein
MSKQQYLRNVENELAILNQTIDRKILAGLGYDNEARRHKRLVGLTRELRKRSVLGQLLAFARHS